MDFDNLWDRQDWQWDFALLLAAFNFQVATRMMEEPNA